MGAGKRSCEPPVVARNILGCIRCISSPYILLGAYSSSDRGAGSGNARLANSVAMGGLARKHYRDAAVRTLAFSHRPQTDRRIVRRSDERAACSGCCAEFRLHPFPLSRTALTLTPAPL